LWRFRTSKCHRCSTHLWNSMWRPPVFVLLVFLTETGAKHPINFCIYNWRVSQHSKSKKFLQMRTRNPRSNLGDVINERDRWDLHTLEEIAQQKSSTEHGWCSRTSRLLLAIRSDPTPQVVMPPRDAHVWCSDISSFLGPASMVVR
jgi:hypothetical protein